MINLYGLLFIVLGMSSLFMINYGIIFGFLICITLIAHTFLLVKNKTKLNTIIVLVNILLTVLEIIGLWLHIYELVYIPQIYCIFLGFCTLFYYFRPLKLVTKISVIIGYIISGLLALCLIITAVFPGRFIKVVADMSLEDNPDISYKVSALDNGGILYSNVHYGDTYPMSEMDIYVANDLEAPVFFYIHGGGYAAGDKVEGDPNANDSGFMWYFSNLMNAGYNIVSVNYALVPEYLYPTPMYQLTEAVEFLKDNGAPYGININEIVFSGSSAGGNLAGQFVNIQTNNEYAKELGMKQVLQKDNIKAVVFNSSLLDNSRFGKSNNGSLGLDYLWFQGGRAYFNAGYLDGGNRLIEQSNVITNVTINFPRTYISDGNTGSFLDQAIDLHDRLDELGIENTFFHVDLSEGVTIHGYETSNTEYGIENMNKLLEFLNE